MDEIYWNSLKAVGNGVVLTAIMMSFISRLYEPRYKKKYLYILAFILAATIKIVIPLFEQPILNILCSFALFHALLFLLYQHCGRKSLFYSISYCTTAVLTDALTVFILSAFGKDTISQALDDHQAMFFSALLNWMMLIFISRLIVYLSQKSNRFALKLREIIFLSFVVVFEIAVIIYILNIISDYSSGGFLIFLVFGFVCFNLYLTKMIDRISRAGQLQYELELTQKQADTQLKYYRELAQKQKEATAVAHDVNAFLNTLEVLYTENETEAADYSLKLKARLDAATPNFFCSSPVLAAIISCELHDAETSEISLKLNIKDVKPDFIDDLDITTIFVNLLDNAFSECKRLPEKKRVIELAVTDLRGNLLICISNPTASEPAMSGKAFKSSKSGHVGLGLPNVKRATEKYGGVFAARVQDDKFIVEITIPFPKNSQ